MRRDIVRALLGGLAASLGILTVVQVHATRAELERVRQEQSDERRAFVRERRELAERVRLELEDKPATPAYTPEPAQAPPRAPEPPAAPPAPPVLASPAPRAAPREAGLTVNSLPASTVMLDGKDIGSTPLRNLQLAPGAHHVRFVTADATRDVDLVLAPGEQRLLTAKLGSGLPTLPQPTAQVGRDGF